MTEMCAAFSPECHGRLEWHHAVSRNRLKRQFPRGAWRYGNGAEPFSPVPRGLRVEGHIQLRLLDEILGDTRNRIWICSFHHERLTNGRLKVELPESVHEFAADFGFTAALENDARRAA